ncbi:MAG: tRNA (adenosine(37)-N6)-dimethylallyltransferase MiaA [Eubacteriales bacterium]|nr:tRNA (adenosine(37)-N6)-dimethylallyltransferase MiaA [Eubacteriales bacterium]
MSSRRPLIVLAGPTAVGKTDLSLKLAKVVNGAIVSADSMQIYKYMDIGSAKIMPEERQGVDHYLIDVLEPEEEFNVCIFQKLAKEAMEQIWAEGKVPILTGGTGFYIQAVLRDIDFSEDDGKAELRTRLEQLAQEKGAGYMHALLQERDPAAAAEIHPNNVKRVIRALEFYEQTGTRISVHNEEQKEKESPYCYLYFVLNDERQHLYERIELRVDQMLQAGLVEEVRGLKDRGLTPDHVSMKGLGYKELFPYLDGSCSLEEAVSVIKRDTRHFAKRQLTWFKREKDVVWVNKDQFGYNEEEILVYMVSLWKAQAEKNTCRTSD